MEALATTMTQPIRTAPGTTIPFDGIDGPGAYVCDWSGHLLRLPEEEVAPGRSVLFNMVGPEPLTVTKISDDPFVTLKDAKLLAADYDVGVNF